jgi:hypothetical protein
LEFGENLHKALKDGKMVSLVFAIALILQFHPMLPHNQKKKMA